MTKIAALVGPTAVGKTEVSLALAEQFGAEIVSVDSMQVYRGMNIGTAKATGEQRERVPHHLLDVFEPSHDVTVSGFQALARAAIADIASRGKLPLLVGGSGLYFRAVVDELLFPPRAEEVRDRLEEEAERDGPEVLHERLRGVDPKAASKIEPTNARRTIRALEVIEITGAPFSDNDSFDVFESIYDLVAAGLTLPRDQLFDRVAERVDDMLEGGLVEEATRVNAAGMSRTARQALGYRQILDAPDADPSELRDAIVKATKKFVRRQEAWFRADPRINWFDASAPGLLERLGEHLKGSRALP